MLIFVVIDDDEHIASGIRDILELDYEDCQVFVAYDGEAGYELIVQHQPDLIICNLMMPYLDGYGVLERLHQSDELAEIPFILFSAAGERTARQKSRFGENFDFITTPFDAEDLLLMVKNLLSKMEHNE
jgi:DNA-binding response OmpR family regulator